jgi:hypothetical protein
VVDPNAADSGKWESDIPYSKGGAPEDLLLRVDEEAGFTFKLHRAIDPKGTGFWKKDAQGKLPRMTTIWGHPYAEEAYFLEGTGGGDYCEDHIGHVSYTPGTYVYRPPRHLHGAVWKNSAPYRSIVRFFHVMYKTTDILYSTGSRWNQQPPVNFEEGRLA